MDIHSSLAQKVSEEYNAKGNVIPPQLHKNVFTSAAIDNFNYNLKSSTASTSIHWTGISIFQHPEEVVTIAPFRFESHCASLSTFRLVTLMYSLMREGKPEPTVQAEFRGKEYISIFEEAKDWFEALMFSDFPENLSFASFYSRKVIRIIPKAVCVLLTLITEDIKLYAVVVHSMEQVRKIIKAETSFHWRLASLRSL